MPRVESSHKTKDSKPRKMRQLPSDSALEVAVLGTCISESQWWSEVEKITGGGQDDDLDELFYSTEASMMARAIRRAKLSAGSGDFNNTDVRSAYASMLPDGEESKANNVVISFMTSTPYSNLDQIKGALAKLAELRAKRGLIVGLKDVMDSLYEYESDAYAAVEQIRELAVHGVVSEPAISAKDVLDRIENTEISPWQVDTGIRDLNKMLGGGFEPGRLTVIGARPKIGKTTFGLNAALNSCIDQDYVTLFVSLEMNDREIMAKMLANLSSIEHRDITRILNKTDGFSIKSLAPEQKEAYLQARDDIANSPLHFMFAENTKRGINDIVDTIMSMRIRYGEERPIAVFFDYLQLGVQDQNNARAEIADMTRRLKLIAMELNVAVVTFSQINRSGADVGMPHPHHMRDAGNIEQDADVTIMMNREVASTEDGEDEYVESDTVDFWLALNRNGPTGYAHAEWLPGISVIQELDEEESSFRVKSNAALDSRRRDDDDDEKPRPRRRTPVLDDDDDESPWDR